jgi:ssDNA-binding Zn-finger/Zn-ribbon topoisomerase 1
MNKRQKFITKALKVHGSKYTYTNVVYAPNNIKVQITCSKHGEFLQAPYCHISGQGCPKCGTEARVSKNTKTTEQFIGEAKNVHKNRYDYSKVEYVGANKPVVIRCRRHGDFKQTPSDHIRNVGCNVCGNVRASRKLSSNKDTFVEKANRVHNSYYTYSQTQYVKAVEKVTITCPVHGNFLQTPSGHLKGSGCRGCNSSGFNFSKPAILYYLNINNGQAYKIGITNRSVNERFTIKDLKSINVEFIHESSDGQRIFNLEKTILKRCAEFKYVGTHLLENGNTEVFSTDIKEYVLETIKLIG